MTEEEKVASDTARGEISVSEQLLEKMAERFDKSAQRWELVVYPAMFAFVLLASYGFYLVYSLTQDMHVLARSMDQSVSYNMDHMSESMSSMTANIAQLTEEMKSISSDVNQIADNTNDMNTYLDVMKTDMGDISVKLNTLRHMNHAMGAMTTNTGIMSMDMNKMNKNVGRPMSMMNSFLPW